MIPTTAGTGSEVTFTAVFTMRETKTKGGINSPFLYPHTAIVDPELTVGSQPRGDGKHGHGCLHPRGGVVHVPPGAFHQRVDLPERRRDSSPPI